MVTIFTDYYYFRESPNHHLVSTFTAHAKVVLVIYGKYKRIPDVFTLTT